MRSKANASDYPLDGGKLFELELGPHPGRSSFRDDDDLRAAWEANRDQILQRYAFRLHHAGWRPAVYWYLEAGDPSLVDDDFRADSPREADRLRWLVEHDAFLPGELDAMRRRARSDPGGYAATAWRIVSAHASASRFREVDR